MGSGISEPNGEPRSTGFSEKISRPSLTIIWGPLLR